MQVMPPAQELFACDTDKHQNANDLSLLTNPHLSSWVSEQVHSYSGWTSEGSLVIFKHMKQEIKIGFQQAVHLPASLKWALSRQKSVWFNEVNENWISFCLAYLRTLG